MKDINSLIGVQEINGKIVFHFTDAKPIINGNSYSFIINKDNYGLKNVISFLQESLKK